MPPLLAASSGTQDSRRRLRNARRRHAKIAFTGRRMFDAGQPLVEALELEGEPFVVDAQAVQDRGVQVVDVDRVLDDVVAEVVGLAVDRCRP